MRSVQVTIDIPEPREVVYDFLDVLANHERFTDHMLKNWHYEGPERGVGSKARVKAVAAGRTDTIDIEVIEAEAPVRTMERNVGAGGRRIATGTYILAALPDGATRVTFEYAWCKAPWSERLASPVVRTVMRRGNERAMQRLADEIRNCAARDVGTSRP
ncbi:MAG: SRPBCC family protein [Actinomycetota bacterium]|nr:SRPBCC family protein [Actinomycetota bacterium]